MVDLFRGGLVGVWANSWCFGYHEGSGRSERAGLIYGVKEVVKSVLLIRSIAVNNNIRGYASKVRKSSRNGLICNTSRSGIINPEFTRDNSLHPFIYDL